MKWRLSFELVHMLNCEGNQVVEGFMGFWDRLRILKMFIQLVKNPTRTDIIIRGIDIASKAPNQARIQFIENIVMSNEKFKAMYEENYVPDPPQLQDLAQLPADSFGYAVYNHMNRNHLTFSVFPKIPSRRVVHYLSTRLYQDHDLWHALLGYGVEIEDELAIQAFGVAQYQSPIAVMLIAGGLLHLLGKDPLRAVKAFQKMNQTYNIGKKAPLILTVRLHDLFAKPLDEVRQICGVA
jgi:ubiquinone biosynthesis protein Coq4